MNVLQTIVSQRRKDVEVAKRRIPLDELRKMAAGRTHHSLIERLSKADGTHIIAEMKKASPSAGILIEDYHPADIARIYTEAGASGISVLTEPHRFLGSEEHLREVRKATSLPLLRKDFICDAYQVYETAALGADVILLIVAAIDKELLRSLYEQSVECGLDVLVEAHTLAELEIALTLEKAIIGVNSRNLKTLETDLSIARNLSRAVAGNRLAIAESGIRTRADIDELEKDGYRGFLIGETILKSGDPASKLRELRRTNREQS
jgi:indole-3-glycerol phosphate synthase